MSITQPAAQLQNHYQTVVIGSGYGASVAALRFAQAGQQVAVLERGREWLPGEFPTSSIAAMAEFSVQSDGGDLGAKSKLFNLRLGDDIHVLTGSGLGGTSLINASVMLAPTAAVLDDPVWPAKLREDRLGLEQAFATARQMLAATPDPHPRAKLTALAKVASALGASVTRPDIAVNFHINGQNEHGASQRPCNGCGDCVAGCNEGAKNTLAVNYLPAAVRAGAQIFCEIEVSHLLRQGSRWQIFYRWLGAASAIFDAPPMSLTADVVFLGAGALGSTEILLRSRAHGLVLSPELGTRMSGNGDTLAFVYNGKEAVNGVGQQPPQGEAPGPCISGTIDLRGRAPGDAMLIEEGVMPSALASYYPTFLANASSLIGENLDPGLADDLGEFQRRLSSLFRGPYAGATRNTLTYLVMADDGAQGRLTLTEGKTRLNWPGAASQPVFTAIDKTLRTGSRALSGHYLRNPSLHSMLGNNLITVHPLGGCPMGESGATAVVNHEGQVFAGADSGLHPGLYVLDGSIMPRALGTNPSLTITALAERALQRITARLPAPPSTRSPAPSDAPSTAPLGLFAADAARSVAERRRPGIGLRFTERMCGQIGLIAPAAVVGLMTASRPAEFILTIDAPSAEQFFADPDHAADLVGTVTVECLATEPLQVRDGRFQLLVRSRDAAQAKLMVYRMTLHLPDGRRLYFEGIKTLHDDAGLDVWADTTSLAVRIADDPAFTHLVAQGQLHIETADFVRQLTTLQTPGAKSPAERLQTIARFGRFFAGNLFEVYGGVVAGATYFDPGAPPRQRRVLQAPIPTVHAVQTPDGRRIRLTRYQGGPKGPLLLLHGLGVSSDIFKVDTIETNLVEYLCGCGFDVWLGDLRVSISLPDEALRPSDADEIALYDIPSLVAEVRAACGGVDVQILAHCYGATTLSMSLLEGLKGVGAVVLSQISTDVCAGGIARLKAGMFLPSILDGIGVGVMNAYTDRTVSPFGQLYDRGVGLMNRTDVQNRCANPVCHRVQFMYSVLYEHEQLNHATHEHLHELFGPANMRAFRHLAAMVRAGHLVDANGNDRYLDSLQGLNRPMLLLHGAMNQCYEPQSTERTLKRLQTIFAGTANEHWFRRQLIPGYGHLDCIFGKNASRDVYPLIAEHFEAFS